MNLDNIPKKITKYLSKYQKESPLKYFKLPESKNISREVCAKVIHVKDIGKKYS